MIDVLAQLAVPDYAFIFMLEGVFKDAVPLMRCCTDREAEVLVIFLKEVRPARPLLDPAPAARGADTHRINQHCAKP